MTASLSTAAFERPSRQPEALLLAGLLRSSRLTLLCGDPGVGKTTLLETGVMPLLRRRAEERAALPPARLPALDPAGVVIPFPDRRQRRATGDEAPLGELALHFDDWHSDPLPRLRRRLHVALGTRASALPGSAAHTLAEELAHTSRVSGLRWLILLDGFERYLEAPPLRTDIERFAEQLIQAVNQPGLPANFLISVRSDARPLLERFRGRLHGLDRNWMNLTARAPLAPADEAPPAARRPPSLALALAPALAPAAIPQVGDGPPVLAQPADGRGAIDAASPVVDDPVVDDFAITAPAMLDQAVGAGTFVSAGRAESAPAGVAATQAPLAAPAPAAPAPAALATAAGTPSRATAAPRRAWWYALPLLLVGGGLAWWSLPPRPPATPPQVRAAARPAPAAPAAVPMPPAWQVQTGPVQRTDARVAAELLRGLPTAGPPGPPLRIAHYDALQAARGQSGPALRVVAPLFPEEIHLLVRADSPLAYMHQIRNSAINVGPAEAGRTPTAALLYERLFGTPLPAAQTRSLGWQGALAALEAGTTDVVALVDAQPSAWLAELPHATRARLKLLALDPRRAESRRALQVFLPATLHDGAHPLAHPAGTPLDAGTRTLAVMSFLVAEGAAPAGAASGAAAATAPAAPAGDALVPLAQVLCRDLPALQRDGHPKWREVQPALELAVGWPYDAAAQQALRACLLHPRPPVPPPTTGDPR